MKIFFSNDEEIKTFSEERKLKESVTGRLIIKEKLKQVPKKRKEILKEGILNHQ